jgi:hypothetical protein
MLPALWTALSLRYFRHELSQGYTGPTTGTAPLGLQGESCDLRLTSTWTVTFGRPAIALGPN